VGDTLTAIRRPSPASVCCVMCRAECRAVTWPISVPEHARQLRLALQMREQAARHIDVAARQRERVDDRVIEDREAPRQTGLVRGARHATADRVHVRRERGVIVGTVLGERGGVAFTSERGLLRGRDQHELALVRDGIGGAAREQRGESECQGGRET
jgi:hypothetical protein